MSRKLSTIEYIAVILGCIIVGLSIGTQIGHNISEKGVTMSNGEQPKATTCPNCQQPAIRTGNNITCESCDAVFVITKKQGAKAKELGPIEDLKKRVQVLEGVIQNAGLPGSQAHKTEQEQEQEQEEEDL